MNTGLYVEDLSVCLTNKKTVVHQVQMNCPRGQITALLGPNGAGKSSLLKGIAGIFSSTGTIRIDGKNLYDMTTHERAKSIAYVPQRSQLNTPMRVLDVVGQGRFAHRTGLGAPSVSDRDAMKKALEDVNGSDLANRVFTHLSGGEQQKVLIARALATGAKTLLLDEPTSALDVHHKLILHALLRRLAERGWCILVVLHNMDEVYRHTDQAVLLAQGKVHTQGASRDVIHPRPIKEIYSVELRYNASIGLFLDE